MKCLALIGAAVLAVVAGCGGSGQSMTDKVSNYLGQAVTCSRLGVLSVAGSQEVVWSCMDGPGSSAGCFASVQGGLVDVSSAWDAASGGYDCAS